MMDGDTGAGWRAFLPPSLQSFPADLTAVVVLSVAAAVVPIVPVLRGTVARTALALPIVLFAPGYAFVALLFPSADSDSGDGGAPKPTDSDDETGVPSENGGIDGIERVALSFGTSVAVVSLVGLVLNFTPWGIQLASVSVSLVIFTSVSAYIASRRRAALDPGDRFSVPYKCMLSRVKSTILVFDTGVDTILSVMVIVSVVLAVGSVGYVVAFPKQGASFSEFYLLTENETGKLVADDYPTEYVAGEPKSLVLGIDNNEHKTISYSVVIELQQVRLENNTTRVLRSDTLHRFSPILETGEQWIRQHQITPSMTGDRLRLVYLLYRGSPPQNPTIDNAYRELRLWISVSSPTNQSKVEPRTAGTHNTITTST